MMEKNYKKLIEKYLSGTISESEVVELLRWLKEDDRLNRWWAEELAMESKILGNEIGMDTDLQNELLCKVKNEIQEKHKSLIILEKKNKTSRSINRNILKWAAVLFLPIVLSISVYLFLDSKKYEAPLIVKTENGSRSEIALPDGTCIKLNSATELSYSGDYGVKERCVRLMGEAFFNVIHDSKCPFIVETGGLKVMVLGTSFNISSYDDEENVSIVLLKGKIGVQVNEQNYLMSPNDRIVYNKRTHDVSTSRVYSQDYVEWTKGSLYFENESLQNIAKVLERAYNIKIQFASEELKKERFSGTLGIGGIQSILEKLTMACPFMYEFKDSVVIFKNIR